MNLKNKISVIIFSIIVFIVLIVVVFFVLAYFAQDSYLYYKDKADNRIEHSSKPEELPLQFPPPQKYKHNFKITTNYDKVDDYTSMDLDGLSLSDGLRLSVYFIYSGKVLTTPQKVTFFFFSSTKNWQYNSYHDLRLLINDSKHIKFDQPIYQGDVERGFVAESMFFDVPIRTFLTIANAKTVEGKLGTTYFKINDSQLEAIRDLASRMEVR